MKVFHAALTAAIVAIATAVPAAEPQASADEAPPPLIPVERFADRPEVGYPRIAPDGRHAALIAAPGGQTHVVIFDLDSHKPTNKLRLTESMEFNWYRWAGPDILLVSISQLTSLYGVEFPVSRLVAFNITNGQQWHVGPDKMGIEGDDVLHVAKDGSSVLLSYQKTIWDDPSVYRVSLLDPKDKGTKIQNALPGVSQWYADDDGVVRLGTGWSGKKLRITYRANAAEKFREIARLKPTDEDTLFNVQRVVTGSDDAFTLDETEDGRIALVRYDLVNRKTVEVIYSNPDWDLSGAMLDEQGKPLAVEYTDDRDRRVWLDPAMAKLQRELERALKVDAVSIGSRADGGTRMLIDAGGDIDPGVLYVYDAGKKTLDELVQYRPKLDIAPLARPKPIKYTARDGTAISGYLTLPRGRPGQGLPLIIMPHGGPYGVRDKLQYDDQVQFLANRGYAVLQPNYRGSDGFGKTFSELGKGQIGRGMQDDIDDAMDWAVKEGIADKSRVCVVGASYGGYAAMWGAIRNPERYRCAASFAGVTDWRKILRYDERFFSREGSRKWNARVTGEQDFDLDSVAPAETIARLKVPLLVAHGRLDSRVPFSQYTLIENAARKAGVHIDTLVFDEEGHGFDKAEDEAKWYTTLEAFLAKNNPA